MIDSVEFRYLDVSWSDPETVKSLEISRNPIPVEELENGSYLIEGMTYQKYLPRIAVHIISEKQLHIPYVKDGEGNKVQLIPVKDPKTQKDWWIHSDGWDANSKHYLTELYRTVGVVELVIQNTPVTLKNNASNLTVDDLEEYLQDFKDGLWQIILNLQSSVKGTVSKSSNMLSEEAISLFRDFADSLEAMMKKPVVELKEVQEKKAFKQVRPVNLTFREIATKGIRKQLTSRSYNETFDTPENRYLHSCAYRVFYIAKQLCSVLTKQEQHLLRMIDNNKRNIDSNNSRKTKTIDQGIFDDETRVIERDYRLQRETLSQALRNQPPLPNNILNIDSGSYRLSVTKVFKKYSGYFFISQINGERVKGNPKFKRSYAVVGMQQSIFDWVLSQRGDDNYLSLTIKGMVQKGRDYSNPEKPFYYIYFHHVEDVVLPKHKKIQDELADRTRRRQIYESKGWEVPLNSNEIKELKRESSFIAKKNDLLESSKRSRHNILHQIEPIFVRLRKINSFFKEHKIKRSAVFPNTMSFVQNPVYSKAKSYFSKINALDGMDGDLFNSLSEFDEIGIVNIPLLYERWCLLQIIKLCSEVYGYEMAGDWQSRLIRAATNNEYNVEFDFHNPINNRRLYLGYEKELVKRGRRPDFVLDMEYQGYVFNKTSPTTSPFSQYEGTTSPDPVPYEQYQERHRNLDSEKSVYDNWQQGNVQRKRLVLDAKFKDNLFQSGFEGILNDLTENKDYDEDGKNQVFLLHPKNDAVQEKTSPLDWGKHSDYGQNLKHKKGFIFLLPSSKYGNTLDNLQRLLGMFIQSASYFLDYGGGAHNFWFDTTCVSCGTSSYDDFICKKKKTEGGNNSWRITCKKCNHLTVKTVCYVCHRDLYKNQFNFTYHRTKAEQVSNIVCPSCQVFL
ncbi:hypothetical protein [Paraferrimonas haliotis]|uniref:Uncharacterized protein n=1 Tax=Paraferrimonas haliotis TaxID=2013866 RepID=A0AA37WYV3_9GAMM|nr:hypothetical protein [Paraferrimonas haliotis]GLS83511.1 hypothetical protein GCM10007894_14880 [Paraferrimonas haliotis]